MRMKCEINSGHKNAIISKWFSYVSYLAFFAFVFVWFALEFNWYRVNKVDSLYEMFDREKKLILKQLCALNSVFAYMKNVLNKPQRKNTM